MKKSHIIMTTSCKGGVGKSTVAANVALCLARLGSRVLLLDLDLGMPCLDIILGCEDKAIFSIADVIGGKIDVLSAAVRDKRSDNLFFCAAPHEKSSFSADEFALFLENAAAALECEYIIIDTPGDEGEAFSIASQVCGSALVICTHAPTAIRAAEKTALHLNEKGVECRLIVNEFDLKDPSSLHGNDRMSVLEMIGNIRVKLLGIVPYSYELSRAAENGRLCCEIGSYPMTVYKAYENIARRIKGENVRLFDGFAKRRKLRRTAF